MTRKIETDGRSEKIVSKDSRNCAVPLDSGSTEREPHYFELSHSQTIKITEVKQLY